MRLDDGASLDSGNTIIQGSQGRWAGEQFMRQMTEGNGNAHLDPQVLRTNGVLRREEWILFDQEVIEGAFPRLRAVGDLIGAGLTKPIANSMGKTVINYDRTGDLADATVSMDGLARTNNDRPDWTPGQLPIPITHKDWNIPLRLLAVSRNGGEGLDTTMVRMAGRKIAEMQEYILINGSKQFAGLPIYGYRTHPERHTAGFNASDNWEDATKTGDSFLLDVMTMLTALTGDQQYGPFWIYVSQAASINLDRDFKANGSLSIRQRLLEVESIAAIRALDYLPINEVLMVQAQRDTVVLLQGEPLQNVQWDVQGGMSIEFKSFMIQVPLIRAIDGQSGIYHMVAP